MYFELLSADNPIDHLIRWNVNECAKHDNANGFIIQHMHILSHISVVKDSDYWEAWSVQNGKIDGNEYGYDDKWSPLPDYLVPECCDEIAESKDGIVIYSSEVYWIPKESRERSLVDRWTPQLHSPANELRMCYKFDCDVEYLICKRDYSWNYKSILEELDNVRKRVNHN